MSRAAPLRDLIVRVVQLVRDREPAAYRWFPPKNAVALTFEYVPRRAIAPPDEPPQSPALESVAELFADIAQLYWLSIASELARPVDELQRDEAWAARVIVVRYGSPFHILVEIPLAVWAGGAAAFMGALATVFGAPYKSAAQFHGSRAEYWRKRLEADEAHRQWLESRRQAYLEEGFRLAEADLPRSAKTNDE
jgi:hypothetical protein